MAVDEGEQGTRGAVALGVVKSERGGSHRTLWREGWGEHTWAFHDGEEIGPRMLARIAKKTGLTPHDL